MFKQKIILLIVICFTFNACTGIKSNNGYMPVQDSVNKLKVKVTSTSFAKSELGEPALVLGSREPIFIYASQVTNRVLFFQPQVISRNVLVLYFDKKKKLKKVKKFNLQDGKSFDPSGEATNLNPDEKSLLAKLFSNIGVGGVRVSD